MGCQRQSAAAGLPGARPFRDPRAVAGPGPADGLISGMDDRGAANGTETAGMISALRARLAESDRGTLDEIVARLSGQAPARATGSVLRPTAAQWRVLEMLGGHDARGVRPRVTDMAAAIGQRRQTVTTHLKALARAGMVRRVAAGDWIIESRGAALLAASGQVRRLLRIGRSSPRPARGRSD